MAEVRQVASQLDSSIPLYGETTLNDAIRRYLSDRLLFGKLLVMLSVLAVTLAAVGLYGLTAYGVTARIREFGIRIALGARSLRVLGSVVREAALIGALGTLAGFGGAFAVATLLRSRLFGVTPVDPPTYVLAAGVLMVVVIVAAVVPARRATRVDPMVALRAE